VIIDDDDRDRVVEVHARTNLAVALERQQASTGTTVDHGSFEMQYNVQQNQVMYY
jgi:hypothetical protein